MKKAHIWAAIWVIIILAPILIIFRSYNPDAGRTVDIVKIGVILPFTASSTEDMLIAEEIRNSLELLPKRALGAGMPPSIVFIYEDSSNDEAKVQASADKLLEEVGVSAIITAPIATSTRAALTDKLKNENVHLITVNSMSSDKKFSCENESLNDVGAEEVAALAMFCKTYQATYEKVPGYYAAYAFDIGNVLSRALDVQRTDTETKRVIRSAFTSSIYRGITGTIRLGWKGSI